MPPGSVVNSENSTDNFVEKLFCGQDLRVVQFKKAVERDREQSEGRESQGR